MKEQSVSARDDRRVHGVSQHGHEIVRYDRAGKWYIEPKEGRRTLIGLHEAARQAFLGSANLGVVGGAQFDAKVRKMRDSQVSA